MSVDFYAVRGDGTRVLTRGQDLYMNLANTNARAFLAFLGIPTGRYLEGSCSLDVAREAVVSRRRDFDRLVAPYVRETVVRGYVTEHGASADQFRGYLDRFAALVLFAEVERASGIGWS